MAMGPPISPTESGNKTRKTDKMDPYKVKAAFLFHFFNYTTWPDPENEKKPEPLELWVIGDDPFGEILDATFKKKEIGGRTVEIERFEEAPEDLTADMIFAGRMEERELTALIKASSGLPLLLIGDSDGFAESGGSGNLSIKDSNVAIEVNTEVVKASGLSISSDLLKLSKIVKTKKSKKLEEGKKEK
tara:strand:- start:608 stop:1171 length:564 start_codon:yes stop_codon:yes gene_type:complete